MDVLLFTEDLGIESKIWVLGVGVWVWKLMFFTHKIGEAKL